MSHLIEEYAKSLGVKIGKPHLIEHYFPIMAEKYITIHCDNKIDSKYYEYFPQVLNLISPILKQFGYKIFQTGGSNDPILKNVDANFLNLNFKQTNFLIKNSSLHLGIDSLPVHIASAYDVPIVVLYSHTYAANAFPYWSSKDKIVIFEPERSEVKPSFSYQEYPKSIRFIKPEEIANAILKLLKIEKAVNFKTLYIGEKYHQPTVEVIPNFKANLEDQKDRVLTIRQDLTDFKEEDLVFWLSNYKCLIKTNKKLPINLLKHFASKIEKVEFDLDVSNNEPFYLDLDYLNAIKRSKIKITLTTKNKKTLPQVRNYFFDFYVNFDSCEETFNNPFTDRKDLDLNNLNIFSNKILISNGNFYSSEAHLKNEKTLDSGAQKSYNDPIFWKDIDYYYFYEHRESNERS
jgi:hypothetical protein